MKIIRFAQVDSMRNDVDLMSGAQTFGQRLHRLGAARGQMHIAAFFGKCFSGRCADAFRCASDQHALSAQMKVHGVCPSDKLVGEKMMAFRTLSNRLRHAPA